MAIPSPRPVEIKALAGARALPPLILVLFHYCEGHGYRGAKWFDLPVGKGYLWVEFFFALSGFVLTYVYGAALAGVLARHRVSRVPEGPPRPALSAPSDDAARDRCF